MLKKLNNNILFILLVLLLTIPAVIGLLHPGFPLTDDGNWMVIRFSAFFQTLRSGELPVRFLMRLNNGYGYPVADFLYPLFMYLSVLIHVLGINFVNSIKMLLIICLFASSLFTFLWLRKFFDSFSSLVGSIFYTFFPYHLFDVYQRGSVGEILSSSILPFILWQIERKSLIWVSIGLAFLILAHNTLAALFIILIIPYVLLDVFISKEKLRLVRFYIAIISLGIGISTFFWLPAIYDLQYTVFSKTQISNVNNYFANFGLVGVSTAFVILSVVVFIIGGLIRIKKHRLTVLMFVISIISIYLASASSELFWKILPSSFVQFPFRLLSLTIPAVAFLAACLVSILSQKKKIVMGLIVLGLIFVSGMSYLTPKIYQNFPDSFYSTNQDTTTVKNEYMPRWVKQIPQQIYSTRVQNVNGDEKINFLQTTANKTIFSVYLTEQRLIQINTVYFPGWFAYVNGKQAEILYNTNGLINLRLEKGINNVQVAFKETPLRLFSDLVSLISLVSLFITFALRKKIRI
jgi:hypothetical protein